MAEATILIVEDELIIALDIEAIVADLGHAVDGPYTTVGEALRAVDAGLPSCAILDVRLPDGEVYPVADLLWRASVPIVFHSGHADGTSLVARYPGAAVCSKPSSPKALEQAIRRSLKGP